MKLGSALFALVVAASALSAQQPAPADSQGTVGPTQALDSGAAHAAKVTSAEIRQGNVPAGEGEHHVAGCEEYAPGDFITPHITDSHCIDLPGFPAFWT